MLRATRRPPADQTWAAWLSNNAGFAARSRKVVSKVTVWRFGRRRWTDRVEDATAWVLLATGLLVVLLGCLFGIGVHDRLVDQARVEALDRTSVDATLLTPSPIVGSDSTLSTPLVTAATWRDGSGLAHTGAVAAQQGLAAGSTVPIWIDRSGAAVPEPTSSGDALKVATITAAMAVVVGTIVLAALWCLLRRITVFYNCAAWEREWREVAAVWSRSEGGRG